MPPWSTQTDQISSWLQSHAQPLASAISNDGERFLVANNKSVFYLTPSGVENDLHRLEVVLGAVDELPTKQESVSTLVLPDELRGLDPLIKVWATSHDSDRSEAIANATDHELDTLWRSVAPYLKEIDALLDASRNDAATIEVGDLAQAAIEARHELDRRGKPV